MNNEQLTPETKVMLGAYLGTLRGIDYVTERLLKRTRKDDKIADLSWLLSAKGECVQIEEQLKPIGIDLASLSRYEITTIAAS